VAVAKAVKQSKVMYVLSIANVRSAQHVNNNTIMYCLTVLQAVLLALLGVAIKQLLVLRNVVLHCAGMFLLVRQIVCMDKRFPVAALARALTPERVTRYYTRSL
tara:strand:+ start:492 stop:803 length:312 start_codon:yes stop_codon:yes gene_type:complete